MSRDPEQLEIDFGVMEHDIPSYLRPSDVIYGDNNMLLSGGSGMCDTITIDSYSWPSSNMSLTSANIPSLTISQIGTATAGLNTISGTSINLNPTYHNAAVIDQSGTLELQGKNADLKINGVSLTETLRSIQDSLNILRPNKELEEKWDQLKELGQQYRQLESEFKEKQKAWETLQQPGWPLITIVL